jgi:hypothetical protein
VRQGARGFTSFFYLGRIVSQDREARSAPKDDRSSVSDGWGLQFAHQCRQNDLESHNQDAFPYMWDNLWLVTLFA